MFLPVFIKPVNHDGYIEYRNTDEGWHNYTSHDVV